ncbi:ankyrin repeat-containing domain protein [Xylariaceae sp. AK1471]|nr:ankyrin repeat-containing domain protein [Xylariaceae sp. AK1471]
MAEVIGIVTGLVGACDVTIKATKLLTKFVSEFKNAPREAKKLRIELENLEAIIGAIQGYLHSSKASQQPLLASSPVGRAIQQCRDYIVNLSDVLLTNNQTATDKYRWALKNKDRCASIVAEIARYTNLFHLALSLDGWELFFKSSSDTTVALKEIRDDLQRVVDAIRPLENMKKDLVEWEDHLVTIKEAIAFSSAVSTTVDALSDLTRKEESLDFITKMKLEPKHRDVVRTRHENTCLWVQECDAFKNWLSGKTASCLWMHGIPGCGKTVAFSSIVDHMMEKRKADEMVVIPTYFTYQDPAYHDVEFTFRAILRYAAHALSEKTGTSEILHKLRQHCHQDQERLPNLQECFDTLGALIEPDTSLILCFDGVDELPDLSQQRLLKALRDLKTLQGVKFIISSRSNLNIRAIDHAQLSVAASEDDLRLYLNSIVTEIMDEIGGKISNSSSNKLKQNIINQIVQKSSSMFLLAALQARQLRSAASVREILELLQSLSHKIDEQYSMYFDRVRLHPRSNLALQAIQWVSCTYRPLRVPELLEALAIRPDDLDFDPTGMIAVDKIIQAAGGLLVLDADSNIIRLVHDSLRDYMDRNQAQILGTPHLSILTILATYLDFRAFDNKPGRVVSENWLDIELLRSKHKLLDYACCHWNYHLHLAAPSGQSLGIGIVGRAAASSALLRITTSTRLGSAISGLSPFDVAVLWENATLAAQILTKFDDVSCAELSVKAYANLTIEDHAGNTPIHTAASHGSDAVLGIYLESAEKFGHLDSIINRLDRPGWTPLHLALSNGHLECATQLLKHGANPNATTVSGQMSAHLAITSCPSALRILQDAGAIFDSFTRTGRSGLHIACARGGDLIDENLRSILETLDINVQDHDGVTPLHHHVRSKSPTTTVIDWLIKRGAEVNIQDNRGLSPLHSSLSERKYQIAEYLLEKGAHTGCESRDGTLPVLIAVGQESCPPQLLRILLNVNSVLGKSDAGSFLHRAVRRQKPNEVNGLLYHGAEVNCKDNKGATPLHNAVLLAPANSRYSTINPQRSNIISLLLQYSADPHDNSYNGFTPVQIAVIRDSVVILRQLLGASDTIDRSYYLPDKVPLVAFSAIHSSLSCFEELFKFIGHQGQKGKLKANHLVDTIPSLLDCADGIFTQDAIANQGQVYRSGLGLPLVPKASVSRGSKKSAEQRCSLEGAHKFSCTNFHVLCGKVVALANLKNIKIPATALHLVARLKIWQSSQERLAGVSDDSELIELYQERPYEARYIDRVFHTGCRQDIVDALVALKWPEKISDPASVFNSRKHLRTDPKQEHYWRDSLALWSSSSTSHDRAESSASSFRRGSVAVPFKLHRIKLEFSRLSIGGGLSQRELKVYDGAREKLLNPLIRAVSRKKSHPRHLKVSNELPLRAQDLA